MSNLKKALLLGVLGATAAASLAGYFLLGGPPARLAVDGALALVQLVIIMMMLAPTEKRVDLLVDALRALARGERHRRVNPDEFAGLAEVARAANEFAASLTENEDPNLGPVKSVPRKKESAALAKPAAPRGDENDPSVGPVRKLADKGKPKPPEPTPAPRDPSKAPEPTPTPEPAASSTASSGTASSGAASREPAGAQSTSSSSSPSSSPVAPAPPGTIDFARPESAAPTNDTAVDEAKGSPASGSASDVGEAEPPVFPTRAELEQLFTDFVGQKKVHEEGVADLDFDAFAQTILGECERLVSAHRCKGVKFEITEQDGEVSLRPRLLR
jgi:outer membrane biosynthesis protein TonB